MILITGANGYIGYELVKKLLEQNKTVRAFCHKESEKINLLKKEYKEKIEIIYGNIEDIENYKLILKDVKIVYHLAGKTGESADIEKINVIATQKLFEQCIKYKIEKVVFFSTVAVYKQEKEVNINTLKQPSNIYGKTKLKAEEIGIEYYKSQKLPLIILEPCSVYGKTYKGSMGKILKRAEKGYCIKIGEGNYKNTYIHIEDLIKIAIKVTESDEYIGKTIICGTETLTIKQINQILKVKEIHISEKIAKLILKLPFKLKIKTTIRQLMRISEYRTNYNLDKFIKFEEYIKMENRYGKKY